MVTGTGSGEPLVSVLLPTHNRADVLPYAIESVLYQSVGDFELIIVGDGCTDDTAAVVGSYSDPRIVWLDLPKAPGFGYANRNVGLRRARGEFIAYMPHDDLWLVDHLELMTSLVGGQGLDFAHSRQVTVDRQGGMWPQTFNIEAATHDGPIPAVDLRTGIAPVLHRRDCLERFGWWDESGHMGGDHRLWHSFIDGGRRQNYAFLPVPTSLHFVAGWRHRERKWWQTQRREMYHSLGFFDLLPEGLSVTVLDGQSEQEAIWTAINKDPHAWAREFRSACQALFDLRLSRMDDFVPLALAATGARLHRLVAKYFHRLSVQESRQLFRQGASRQPSGPEPGTSATRNEN